MKSTRQKVYIAIAVTMIVISAGLIIYRNVTGKNIMKGESGTRVFSGPITEIVMDIGACDVEIIEADTTDIIVAYSNLSGSLSDQCYEGTLSVTHKSSAGGILSKLFGGSKGSGKITITIPKDVCFDSVAFEFGAGEAEIYGLCAKKMCISAGAGEVSATNIRATKKAELEIGAGKLNAKNVEFMNASLECGVGSMEIEGVIEGKSSIDCGVGSVKVTVRGEESNYKGDLDCGIGKIVFGSTKIDGIGSEKTVANDTEHSFDVDCGVGEVKVKFEK